ncbi:MAG: hypothetical protein U0168_03845 [Nannocystaceae bacterium]
MPQPPQARPSQAETAQEPSLPAGLYFRNGYVRCDGCPAPRWAVVAGIVATARQAEATLATAAAAGPLDLGFPLALHTDELALVDGEREGIAIVVGWFADRDAARRRADRAGYEVVELLDEQAAFTRQWDATERDPDHPRRYVVQLDARGPVPGFALAAVEAAETTLSTSTWNSYEAFVVLRDHTRAQLEPVCEIDGARLFVADDAQAEPSRSWPYAWQPVTCDDGRPALVRQIDTRRHAIVSLDGARVVIDQVVGVECDRAIYERWAWRDGHRLRADSTTALPGPC